MQKPYHPAMSRDFHSAFPLEYSSALTRFVEERSEGLVRFAIGLGASGEDAKDLVQEGMLRLMRYSSTPPTEWTPLVYRIVLNLHRDRQRQVATQGPADPAGGEDHLAHQPSPQASPERHASDQQQLALVRAAILDLPPRCREVYLLNRLDGLSYPAIAQRCGISLKAVEKHVSRALRELRRKVGRDSSHREDP